MAPVVETPLELHDEGLVRFRTIFISDTHLGTPGCQAAALLEFLRATESDFLYLVGDIIDGWQLKRRWYWHQLHNDVVQKVLRKARKGTQSSTCRATTTRRRVITSVSISAASRSATKRSTRRARGQRSW